MDKTGKFTSRKQLANGELTLRIPRVLVLHRISKRGGGGGGQRSSRPP